MGTTCNDMTYWQEVLPLALLPVYINFSLINVWYQTSRPSSWHFCIVLKTRRF
jgi:hypothetical protein